MLMKGQCPRKADISRIHRDFVVVGEAMLVLAGFAGR
jgi:hypothetical protein